MNEQLSARAEAEAIRSRRRDLAILAAIGWVFAFGGLIFVDFRQHQHRPPLAEVLEMAAIATFLGPMLGLIGGWKLGFLTISARATRRLFVALVVVVVVGVLVAMLR